MQLWWANSCWRECFICCGNSFAPRPPRHEPLYGTCKWLPPCNTPNLTHPASSFLAFTYAYSAERWSKKKKKRRLLQRLASLRRFTPTLGNAQRTVAKRVAGNQRKAADVRSRLWFHDSSSSASFLVIHLLPSSSCLGYCMFIGATDLPRRFLLFF